jgi:hypothetical protein
MKAIQRFCLMSRAEKDKVRAEIVARCRLAGDCWLYPVTNSKGYGTKWINGRAESVSRFMLAYATCESLTIKYDACHVLDCPYRACCNPLHLFWGTHSENAAQREREARDWRKMDVVMPPVPLGHVTHEQHILSAVDSTVQGISAPLDQVVYT